MSQGAESPSSTLLLTHGEGVLHMVLNRSDKGNALSLELVSAITVAVQQARDLSVRLLVISGAGKHFCTGFDLSTLDQESDDSLLARFTRVELMLQAIHSAPFGTLAVASGRAIGAGADLFCACSERWIIDDASFSFPGSAFGLVLGTGADVSNLPELWRCIPGSGFLTDKPIIAATAGWVVGGSLVLAMICDLLVAAENSKFSFPEARLGFTGGMIAALAGRIPHKAAMDIMLLGRTMDARRAYDIGLASELAPTGKQVEVAMQQAQEMARSAPLVLQTIKRFVHEHVMPKGPSERMSDTIRLNAVRESADGLEGVAAFREKRKPQYIGR